MSSTNGFQKKNSVVTGGAGFLGSHLCEALLREGRVICIDDLSNGSSENIEHLLSNPDFVFLKHDVSIPVDLETFAELERFKIPVQGVQEIFHFACPMNIKNFNQNRIAVLNANSAAVKATLDWAIKYKARYIFASSSCVYGSRVNDQKIDEHFIGLVNHATARAAYDEGKRFAETMIMTYADVYGIDARIARLFRTYGPRMNLFDAHMITEFVLTALDNQPMKIFGTSDFKTTLLYVSDALSGILKLAKAPAGIGPVNIGSDEEFTFTQVAEKVRTIVGSTSEIVYEDSKLEFLSQHPIPDTSYAKDVLGWIPLTRLENGLQHMVDFVSANRHKLTYSV